MPPRKIPILVAGLILLYFFSVLLNLGYLELAGEEPRRAVISLEMLHSGNFINPTYLGWNYYNKPVLFNWILCATMYLTKSSSEFVLRLPSIIFYLLWAFCHYKISTKFFSKHIAFASTFFMLTSGDLYFYGLANGAEIDIFYSFIIYLQALSIFYFFLKKEWSRLFVFSYLFTALGFLTKGFPSVLFQGLTLAALCYYAKSIKILWRKEHLFGVLVFSIVTGVYFFVYSFYNSPLALIINFLDESILKSAIGEQSGKLVQKSVFYPFMLIKLLAPWPLLLLFLSKKLRVGLFKNPLVKFSLLFIVFNLWVYWLTGQPKARYIYMFVPFACVIFAAIYEKVIFLHTRRFNNALNYLGSVFVLVLLIVLAFPFFEKVSWLLTTLLAITMAVFIVFYFRLSAYRFWLFITGIILCRIIYASLFIPIQYEKSTNYSKNIKEVVQRIKGEKLAFWGPSQTVAFTVNSKILNHSFDTIPDHAPLHSQVPYYYFKYTRRILYYDTVLTGNKYYLAFRSDIKSTIIDTIYSFENKKQTGMILFRLKAPGNYEKSEKP
jgi:4-amino-4-deoxy-L-arabinose transferase-like glycosyltransferase